MGDWLTPIVDWFIVQPETISILVIFLFILLWAINKFHRW